jgi:oxepin-CoA hydrolase/3-oxo-5,6-dehydrosuberyl-CoA semialdehyde dehydrogenase
MDEQKLNFITTAYLPLLKNLPADDMGKWGKMNAQQMVEHVAAFFAVSAGKIKFDLVTPVEHLPKYRDFLFSDKEFRENTKAPVTVIGEEALPLRYATMEEALENLSRSIIAFENYFKEDVEKKTLHPVFGELNFEEWVLLHYKHVMHHARQFGLGVKL